MGAGGYREMMLCREERHQANFSTHTLHTQLSKPRLLGGLPEDLEPATRLRGLYGPISLSAAVRSPSWAPFLWLPRILLCPVLSALYLHYRAQTPRRTGLNRESSQFP